MRAERICRIAYLTLALVMLAWYGWLFPSRTGLIVVTALLSMGGLMLFTASAGQLVWGGMIVLLLFIHGVTEAMVHPAQRWVALLVVALTLVYFAGLWIGIRAARARKRAAAS